MMYFIFEDKESMNKKLPLISVTVPIYNVEKYLPQCVESLFSQTYPNYELLLIDDGSPDNCPEICDEYALADDRVIVVHKNNGGLSDARNAGIELASGEYLSFVDSDDYVGEDFLESMYSALNTYDCELAICNITSVDGDEKQNERFYQPFTELTLAQEHEKYESLSRHSAWNKLYKRDIFDSIRYPKGKLYEDLYVYHYILDKVDRTVYTGKSSYYYRLREGSIMSSPYSIHSTDIVWGYHNRARFYDRKKEYRLADDAYLWVYSRTAVAFSHLDKSIKENAVKLKEVKKVYNSDILRMILFSSFSLKQRLRCLVLLVSPALHEKFFSTAQVNN